MFERNKKYSKTNVNSWCEYSVIFFSFLIFFYRVLNHNNRHMVTCFFFNSFIYADKVALDSANYFNNNNNNNNNSNFVI